MNSFKDSRLAVVRLSDDEHEVIILDQTRLPGHEEYLRISDEERAWTAIKRLEIRGAPAIGVFAGYAMYHRRFRRICHVRPRTALRGQTLPGIPR